MEQAAPDKMKVAELRAALQERGLDTKGTKPVLVARLQEAFDAEKPAAEEEVPATTAAAAADEKMETEAAAAEEPAKAESMETGEGKTEETPAEGKPSEKKTEANNKVEEKKEDEKGTKRKADEEPPFEVKENEPEIPEALVCLDWYNSDLNLRITDNYMTGIPFSRDGWGYCYAGARATYGFNSGKVWFEVKYLDNLDVKVEKDAVTFDLRVGWSSNKGSLMLGEDDKP